MCHVTNGVCVFLVCFCFGGKKRANEGKKSSGITEAQIHKYRDNILMINIEAGRK